LYELEVGKGRLSTAADVSPAFARIGVVPSSPAGVASRDGDDAALGDRLGVTVEAVLGVDSFSFCIRPTSFSSPSSLTALLNASLTCVLPAGWG